MPQRGQDINGQATWRDILQFLGSPWTLLTMAFVAGSLLAIMRFQIAGLVNLTPAWFMPIGLAAYLAGFAAAIVLALKRKVTWLELASIVAVAFLPMACRFLTFASEVSEQQKQAFGIFMIAVPYLLIGGIYFTTRSPSKVPDVNAT